MEEAGVPQQKQSNVGTKIKGKFSNVVNKIAGNNEKDLTDYNPILDVSNHNDSNLYSSFN